MFSVILHGKRLVELQKCCHLRISLQNASAYFNPFSSTIDIATDVSPRDGRKEQNFTVSYLVDSLGLARKLAESISRKVILLDKGNADSVLSLLRSHGFTDTQISTIITIYPRLLLEDTEKSLGPKLHLLQSSSSSELTEIISTVPQILGKGRSIRVYYDFVNEVIKSDKSCKFEKFCHSLPKGKLENKIRNLSVLRGLGVPQKLLFPLLISNRPHVYGKERFEESLKKVMDMGFDPTTYKFLHALGIVYGLKNETSEEKVNVFKRLGFAVEDVWEMFKKWPLSLTHSEKKITRRFETLKKTGLLNYEIISVFKKFPQSLGLSEEKIESSIDTFLELGFSKDEFLMMVKCAPTCIGLSAESVKKKTEFVVKKMNWPLKALVSNPHVLGYSLEKRTVPRCNVIKALLSKGLLGSELPPISSVFVCTDDGFLKRYVRKQEDKQLVSDLMAIFTREKSK